MPPLYSYKGYDAQTGAIKKGKQEAESERSLRQALRHKSKVIVTEVKEESAKQSSSSGSGVSLFAPRVGLAEVAVMVRQFATLQAAHIPLDESLKALVSQIENETLRKTVSAVKDSVSEGKSLAEASSAYPNIFNRLFVNMVRAGESSGTLSTVLLRLAEFMEYQLAVRGKVVQAMIYPAIMIFASLSIVVFLMVVIVPKLTKVFESLKVTVPWYTELLINFSGFIQEFWYLVVFGFGAFYFLIRAWINSETGRRQWDRLSLKMPIFGQVVLMVAVSRFTKTLSTLLSSGVAIDRSLDITKNVVNNSLLTDVLETAKTEVREGNSFAACISRSGVFPGLVSHMIAIGEKTGELEQMLAHVAKAYDSEVETKIAKMISLVEPIMMILLMGIAVFVIGAMIMPMMDVMKQVR